MVHCVWCRRIEISGSARQCQQRHFRLSPPQQVPPRPRHTSAWLPSRPFTSMVTPKTRPEKRKHAIVVHVRSNRGGRRFGAAIRCGAGTKSASASAQIVRMLGLQARPLSGGRPSIRKFCLPSNRCGQPVGESSHIFAHVSIGGDKMPLLERGPVFVRYRLICRMNSPRLMRPAETSVSCRMSALRPPKAVIP
jgi:hypothetical protein